MQKGNLAGVCQDRRDPWGIVYKIVRGKLNKPSFWSAVELPNGQTTSNIDETMQALLTKCVPKEDGTRGERKEMEQRLSCYKNQNMERPITIAELKSAIEKFKNNKAPGSDNFNNCFNQKEFPKIWKVAKLKIILKDEKRDRRHLNSYKPIALLSVVGKIYEKVIVERIQQSYEEQGLASSKQFGFRKGKGVYDAFLNIRRVGDKVLR